MIEECFGCDAGRKTDSFGDTTVSDSMYLCSRHRGDIFSVQELAHLPIISSGSTAHLNVSVSKDEQFFPNSPQLFSLITPEKRPGWESRCSSSISKCSSAFGSIMPRGGPSPSKLFFSPVQKVFSPGTVSSPQCLGEFQQIFDDS